MVYYYLHQAGLYFLGMLQNVALYPAEGHVRNSPPTCLVHLVLPRSQAFLIRA